MKKICNHFNTELNNEIYKELEDKLFEICKKHNDYDLTELRVYLSDMLFDKNASFSYSFGDIAKNELKGVVLEEIEYEFREITDYDKLIDYLNGDWKEDLWETGIYSTTLSRYDMGKIFLKNSQEIMDVINEENLLFDYETKKEKPINFLVIQDAAEVCLNDAFMNLLNSKEKIKDCLEPIKDEIEEEIKKETKNLAKNRGKGSKEI